MPKLPDISKMIEKIDVEGFVDNVKSMLNPETGMPSQEAVEKNPQLAKLVELSLLLQNIAQKHEEQGKEIAQLARLVNQIYRDFESTDEVTEKQEEKPLESEDKK